MFFSIIVAFRNRELSRVKNALDSISKQSYKDLELIFTDYGSNQEVASETRQLASKYSFCKYYYIDTRGWFWNRSHALNTGIRKSSGDVLLIYDIDLIIEDSFLEKIAALNFNSQFFTFSCFYLPRHFDVANANLSTDGIHYEQNYVGLCAVQREFVERINGFDEYYMVWGGEDDDFYQRLQRNGLQRQQMEAYKYLVFHQWHSLESPVTPSLWYLTMVNYLFRQSNSKRNDDVRYNSLSNETGRVIFERIEKKDFDVRLTLSDYSSFLIFNDLIRDFYSKKFKSGYFTYTGSKSEMSGGKSFNLFKNRRKKKETPSSSNQHLIEFFQYFIGINRSSLQDYYFESRDDKISFYYIKN